MDECANVALLIFSLHWKQMIILNTNMFLFGIERIIYYQLSKLKNATIDNMT